VIPTIEDIINGMEVGSISREQGIAWLHQHAQGVTVYQDEDRTMLAGWALQALITALPHMTNATGPNGERLDEARLAKQAVYFADELMDALKTPPSEGSGQ
jgi:hypothetical protein